MQEVLSACFSGQMSDAQIASFLVLMRSKGESVDELTTAAKVMQELAHTIQLGPKLIDIVGTGGDGKNTFNVSTAASFVVAASGIAVAKHGNRSVSSASGSADVLEQAGFVLQLSDEQLQTCISTCNLAFLFAPHYHPAMKYARQARQELGIRTFFNLLGPLINPARVQRQVVGVFSKQWLQPLVQVLIHLGSERCLVINAQDGLDEISIAAPTDVVEYHKGQLSTWVIHPEQYGLKHGNITKLIVDSPAQSLQCIQSVLRGELGPARDMVLLNSAAALYCADAALSFGSAIDLAKTTIDEGKAQNCFNTLKELTQTLTKDNHE